MLKILFVGSLGLSPAISGQFILEICVSAGNREKFTKNPHFGVQGHSRSSTFVLSES